MRRFRLLAPRCELNLFGGDNIDDDDDDDDTSSISIYLLIHNCIPCYYIISFDICLQQYREAQQSRC